MVAVKSSCQVPIKLEIMNRHCNTGVRCNSIQSGVTTSGQVYRYHMKACQVSSDSISISGVRYQMLSDNMSSISVR